MSVQEWFKGAGLGLFVHWDHASQQGIELSWPLVGKSIVPGAQQVEDEVSIAQYQSSAATFHPERWDPAGLARLARSVRCPLCGADIQASRRLLHVPHQVLDLFHRALPLRARHRA